VFLEQLQSKTTISTLQKLIDHVDYVVNTYVMVNSPKQINVSANERDHVVNHVNLWKTGLNSGDVDTVSMTSSQPFQHFKSMKLVVETEMMCDVLPRFLRSQIWTSLVYKNDLNIIRRVGRHKRALEMSYSDDDFVEHVVEDRDLKFQWSLSEDNADWKLVGWSKKRKIMAFSSSHILEYFPDVSWMREGSVSKFIGILPFSFEVCEHYLFHSKYMQVFDDNVVGHRTLEYYTHEELKLKYPTKNVSEGRTCAVVMYNVKFPFPLAPRVYCVAVSGYFDKESMEGVLIYKPCHHPELDKINRNRVCFFRDIQLYLLKKIDDQRTMYFQIHACDVGSSLGNKLAKLVMYQRSKQLSANINKFLRSVAHLPIPEPDLEDGVMRTYLDHKSHTPSVPESDVRRSSSDTDSDFKKTFGSIFA